RQAARCCNSAAVQGAAPAWACQKRAGGRQVRGTFSGECSVLMVVSSRQCPIVGLTLRVRKPSPHAPREVHGGLPLIRQRVLAEEFSDPVAGVVTAHVDGGDGHTQFAGDLFTTVAAQQEDDDALLLRRQPADGGPEQLVALAGDQGLEEAAFAVGGGRAGLIVAGPRQRPPAGGAVMVADLPAPGPLEEADGVGPAGVEVGVGPDAEVGVVQHVLGGGARAELLFDLAEKPLLVLLHEGGEPGLTLATHDGSPRSAAG